MIACECKMRATSRTHDAVPISCYGRQSTTVPGSGNPRNKPLQGDDHPCVLYSKERGIATITINRPKVGYSDETRTVKRAVISNCLDGRSDVGGKHVLTMRYQHRMAFPHERGASRVQCGDQCRE